MGAFNIGVTTIITTDAAYVHESFTRVGLGTTENVKIAASDGTTEEYFGEAVAVGSGRIVVGVKYDDDPYTESGSAYIYDLDGNNEVKIIPSDPNTNDNFGNSVAAGCGRIVVGSYREDPAGKGVDAGSAYIFDLDGNQLAKITASNGGASDSFGSSVAVGSNRIVVGAESALIDGLRRGAAYIFDLSGTQLGIMTAFDGAASDQFGHSVAVGNGRIVVGARFDDDAGSSTGSAYLFDLSGAYIKKLTASDAAGSDRFGKSVAVGCGKIVIGAPNNDDPSDSGSVYIYDLNGNNEIKITASDADFNDYFGESVSVGSSRIVVGALFNNLPRAYVYDLDGNNEVIITGSSSSGSDEFGYSVAVGSNRIVVGSRKDDDTASNSGAAYIFNLPEDSNTYWERILETYKYSS